jgi:hypothetical protein
VIASSLPFTHLVAEFVALSFATYLLVLARGLLLVVGGCLHMLRGADAARCGFEVVASAARPPVPPVPRGGAAG